MIDLHNTASRPLKGMHHHDFAVLGQFCVKIMTKFLYLLLQKNLLGKTKRKISNKLYHGELTIIILITRLIYCNSGQAASV